MSAWDEDGGPGWPAVLQRQSQERAFTRGPADEGALLRSTGFSKGFKWVSEWGLLCGCCSGNRNCDGRYPRTGIHPPPIRRKKRENKAPMPVGAQYETICNPMATNYWPPPYWPTIRIGKKASYMTLITLFEFLRSVFGQLIVKHKSFADCFRPIFSVWISKEAADLKVRKC